MRHLTSSRQTGAAPNFVAASRPLRLLALFLLAPALAALAGCVGNRGGPIPYGVQNFGAPDAPAVQALEDDYKIAPLDTLHINVFEAPDLTGDFDVDLTGNVSLPLVGSIKAVDLTTREFDERLTKALGERYLQHPDVSVAVKASSTRVVTVEGAVKTAGVFPVTGRLTLLQVIALAHGTDESANPHRVAVFRTIQGQRMAAAFDLTQVRRGEAEDPRIYSGDVVVVDGSKVKSTWQTILQSLPLLSIFRPF